MIEIEFSALARQYLNRRIPTIELLAHEVLSWFEQRRLQQTKISWQFSLQSARTKFNSHYVKVHPENLLLDSQIT